LREKLSKGEFEGLTQSDQKAHLELIQYEVHIENERLLVELASLHDSGYARFKAQWGYDSYPEELVIGLRDYLRAIWKNEVDTRDVNKLLADWLIDTGNLYLYRLYAFYPDVESGELIANSGNLKARVALSVLARYHRMQLCANPDCVVPFFLAKRATQKFCQRGECTRYAQNQYALRWWREKQNSPSTKTLRRNKRGTRKTR
jgi:hypothetical protein